MVDHERKIAPACVGVGPPRQHPRKVARNSIERSFNKRRKRCNSNETHSRFETVAGELRAKLVSVGGCAGCGGRGRRGPGYSQQRKHRRCGGRRRDRRTWENFEAGPGCGGRGRWRGLAGLLTATQAPPVWRAPEGPEGTGGLRGAAPNEVRTPSLAGGRALRRPEHQRGHKHKHDKAGRNPSVPARPRCSVVISSARPPCRPCRSSRR